MVTTSLSSELWAWAGSGLLISMLEKLIWFRLTGLITLVLLMWWMGLLLRKNHLLKCWGWVSLLNWVEALTLISIAETVSKEVWVLICSMTFLSPEVALYHCKSTTWLCMEYCFHVWADAPSCYLELLDKLQKQMCRNVIPSRAASLEPIAHCRNVTSLCLLW